MFFSWSHFALKFFSLAFQRNCFCKKDFSGDGVKSCVGVNPCELVSYPVCLPHTYFNDIFTYIQLKLHRLTKLANTTGLQIQGGEARERF